MRNGTRIKLIVLLGLLLGAAGVILASRPLVWTAQAQEPAVLYVKPTATGDGDCGDWDNACTLQSALSGADPGDEIWVAKGIHKPGTVPTDTFQLQGGVEIYGGFDPSSGVETPEQRDPAAHVTVLSGDIDGNDVTDPNGVITDTTNISGTNSYHIVTGSGVTETAVLDGFTVTAGNANGSISGPWTQRCGGGMHNQGGSPTLANVTFSGNAAVADGGGMYNISDSSPALTNVTFSGNQADFGGGMLNIESSPALTGTLFISNTANQYGGGMYNRDDSSPTLANVLFADNSATYGGGMHNFNGSNPTLTGTQFISNSAGIDGGGMHNAFGSSPTLTGTQFISNSAAEGGGMHNENGSSPTLTATQFISNTAGLGGGGMFNDSSSPTLTGTQFISNTAGIGGGMFNAFGSSPTLIGTQFISNTAGLGGGGMHNESDSNPALTNVTFSGNQADFGGGMYSYNSSPALTNVTFSGNATNVDGGGILVWGGSVTLTHCTVTGNTADLDGHGSGEGGGIYHGGGGSVHVKNTIIAANSAGLGSGPDLWGEITSLGYNLVGNADDATFVPAIGDQVGSGTAPLDPLLAGLALNPPGSTATHALLKGSPALDWIPYGANGCGSEVSTDQRGVPRPFPAEGACDVGAYEVSPYFVYLPLVLRNLSAQ